jgi:hypothetical protein
MSISRGDADRKRGATLEYGIDAGRVMEQTMRCQRRRLGVDAVHGPHAASRVAAAPPTWASSAAPRRAQTVVLMGRRQQ